MTKLDKPARIHIEATISLHGTGGFYTLAPWLTSAFKQLDRADYVTLDGSNCYPVATLKDILSTYSRDCRVDLAPITAYSKSLVEECATTEEKDDWGRSVKVYSYTPVYTPVYNALAISEHRSGSTQRVYSVRREKVETHVAELTTEWIEEPTAADPWINKAISKDKDKSGTSMADLLTSGGNIASDGTRLHYNPSLPAREWQRRDECLKWFIDPGRKNENVVTLDPSAARKLIAACKQALKIKATFIKLSVNGSLEYSAHCDDFETSGTISAGYAHSGNDVTIGINPRYLMDAMDKPAATTIRIKSAQQPVYLTDGTRESVIMPMRLDDPKPVEHVVNF